MKLNSHRAHGHPVRTINRGQQAGFIQAALLFGIALITAVLGGYALANRTPTSQTGNANLGLRWPATVAHRANVQRMVTVMGLHISSAG